jgi:hypothetical protein
VRACVRARELQCESGGSRESQDRAGATGTSKDWDMIRKRGPLFLCVCVSDLVYHSTTVQISMSGSGESEDREGAAPASNWDKSRKLVSGGLKLA